MGEIRNVGPGKTRGYLYPVCKKEIASHEKHCLRIRPENMFEYQNAAKTSYER